ncbi:MAG: hypothetical protein ABFC94_17505 [Syntrophomonas sp.]
MAKSWAAGRNNFDNFFDFLRADKVGSDVPAEITGPLAKWSLLYDVPFGYLVPNEKMLPPESIRFFYMDHDYLFALLDGAMSLGRLFDVDYQHDGLLIEQVMAKVFTERLKVRPRLQRKTQEDIDKAAETNTTGFVSTGFLLRSELVLGWRGLEFKAFDAQGNTLQVLRLETLGPRILLGIFIGECDRLEIAQPPESMYFGFETKSGGGYEKLLRKLDTGELYDKEGLYADVVPRPNGRRVVDWTATAQNIQDKLSLKEVNSADLALEMIQNPATGEILRQSSAAVEPIR